MKRVINISRIIGLLIYLTVFLITGCESESADQENSLSVSDFTRTDCKGSKGIFTSSVYLKAVDNSLLVFHEDAIFNCCLETITVDCSINNDTIYLEETEIGALCDCICPYDISFTISSLEEGNYIIKINQHSPFKIKFSPELDDKYELSY